MSSNTEKVPGPTGDQPEQPVDSPPAEEKKKREYKDFGHDEEKPTRKSLQPSNNATSLPVRRQR